MPVKVSVNCKRWKDLQLIEDGKEIVRLELLMKEMALDWTFSRSRECIFLEHHPKRGSSTLKKDGFGTFI